jgi:formylglycine-generating enzyme required for sulfatase activity
MGSKVFISYRRGDVRSDAARIRDRLAAVFGAKNVFMDVENLVAGQRFDMALNKELAQCDVLLAIIGPHWLGLLKERQDGTEGDFVREEIAAALKRGIPVIPVLIDRTPLPRADQLPEELRNLVMHHKHDITHEHFGREVEELITAIKAVSPKDDDGERARKTRRLALMAVGVVAVFTIVAVRAYYAGPFGPSAGEPVKPMPGDEKKVAALDPAETERKREQAELTRPGRVFRDCPDLCPEMVVMGQGEFKMGSADGEDDERPVHKVTIAKPFAVGKFEVTFAEWDACVNDGGCEYKPDADWGRERQPVMRISWDDVTKEYLPWLSRKAGAPYRLLSEAEWEYVARQGTTSPFVTGDAIQKGQAQFAERRPSDVGSFPAGPWGVHDMAGNVWEWVQDCHNDSYSGLPTDGRPAPDTLVGCVRVMRGGSWGDPPDALRSSNREWDSADSRRNVIGFRVARSM